MRMIEEIKVDLEKAEKCYELHKTEWDKDAHFECPLKCGSCELIPWYNVESIEGEFFRAIRGIFTLDSLEEICNAERDGRLVVLFCGIDLMKIYSELTSICEGDAVENYTNGYRWGHKNGQIELIRRLLNINEGVSHKPEQALKGGAE